MIFPYKIALIILTFSVSVTLTACGGSGGGGGSDAPIVDDGSDSGNDDDNDSGDDSNSDSDGGSDSNSDDNTDGNTNNNSDSNSGSNKPDAPAWASLRKLDSSENIQNIRLNTSSGGDAFATWIKYQRDTVGRPYDLFSARYTVATDWGDNELLRSVGTTYSSTYSDSSQHLLNSGFALLERNTKDAFSYGPARGWVREALVENCCKGVQMPTNKENSFRTMDIESRAIRFYNFTFPTLVETSSIARPFSHTPDEKYSSKLIAVKASKDDSLLAIEQVIHETQKSPRPGDPLATYSYVTLWTSTYASGSWSEPQKIYTSGETPRSGYYTPIRDTNIAVDVSPNGNAVISWVESYTNDVSSNTTRVKYRAMRRIGGVWEEPKSPRNDSDSNEYYNSQHLSIDNDGNVLLVSTRSSYNRDVYAYSTNLDGSWATPINLRYSIGSDVARQTLTRVMMNSSGVRLFASKAYISRTSSALVRWFIPGKGWSQQRLVGTDVSELRTTLSDSGDATLLLIADNKLSVTRTKAPK